MDEVSDESDLLLDRIDALRVLRADTPEEKGRLLEEIGGTGKPEQDIVRELSKIRPLWRPDRFEEAHHLAMRSLEVLDRNGARPAKMPRLGPLTPIARFAVQQVNRWIVKSHQNTLVERVRRLYERREANAPWDSPERYLLKLARTDAEQVEGGLRGKALGLPTFLLGGAFLSSIVSGVSRLVSGVFGDEGSAWVQVVIVAAVVLLLFALAWVVLYAAAVSRRRIHKCVDQPMKALYETIGACGDPPRDQSYNFALYALVFLVLAAIIVPIAGTVLVSIIR